MKDVGDEGPLVVDLGCGPSICNVISASRISSRIHLADLLEGNRRELTKWINRADNCWNWDPYFVFQGVLELEPNTQLIEQRVRSSISGVTSCDLANKQVFSSELHLDSFHVMICSLVWDVVAVNPEQLETVIKRCLSWLKPQGVLLVQGSLHEFRYCVGSAQFPVLNIDKESLFNVFEKCGLQVLKWETVTKGSTHYFVILKRM